VGALTSLRRRLASRTAAAYAEACRQRHLEPLAAHLDDDRLPRRGLVDGNRGAVKRFDPVVDSV
jgi:hypothetical protein